MTILIVLSLHTLQPLEETLHKTAVRYLQKGFMYFDVEAPT